MVFLRNLLRHLGADNSVICAHSLLSSACVWRSQPRIPDERWSCVSTFCPEEWIRQVGLGKNQGMAHTGFQSSFLSEGLSLHCCPEELGL